MADDKSALCYWQVYAGPSLKSTEAEPVEIMFDNEIHTSLHNFDHDAWRVLLRVLYAAERRGQS